MRRFLRWVFGLNVIEQDKVLKSEIEQIISRRVKSDVEFYFNKKSADEVRPVAEHVLLGNSHMLGSLVEERVEQFAYDQRFIRKLIKSINEYQLK